jgi:integration host factor subunit beta
MTKVDHVPTGGSKTKAELVEEVSRVSDLTKKHSEVIVDTVFRSIVEALHRGEKIELRGFGSFRLRKRGPRKGRNTKIEAKEDAPSKRVQSDRTTRHKTGESRTDDEELSPGMRAITDLYSNL